MSFNLEERNGWPEELRVLLRTHPRDSWHVERCVDALLWLEIHAEFRRDCAALEAAADDYSSGRAPARSFAVVCAPRLQVLLSSLRGHHEIEDHHYFPAFRSAEPRLAHGFDLLENDHAVLAADAAAAFAALRELRAALERPPGDGATDLAARSFAAAGRRLYRRLVRHLGDEEDLVVPLLLERKGQ